jgi:hypothetical protein
LQVFLFLHKTYNMKKWLVVLIWALAVGSCTQGNDYAVERYLDGKQKDDNVWKIIRYVSKPPDGLLYEERFYPAYDTFYHEQASRHRFEEYFIDQQKQHYFLISRPAPSLVEKRVATGGKMKFDDSGNLLEYEEVFRTWKMVPDTLKERGLFLFDKMVKGEDLVPYYTKNSLSKEYIEFPDDINYYDKATRRWRQR